MRLFCSFKYTPEEGLYLGDLLLWILQGGGCLRDETTYNLFRIPSSLSHPKPDRGQQLDKRPCAWQKVLMWMS